MTDTAIANIERKSVKKPHKDFKITRAVRTAIEALVWDGLPRKEAAAKAGISDHGLYKALRSPPVKAAYLAELDVLRSSERARNIHALVEVRDQKSNQMARVQAVKALEQISDDAPIAGAKQAMPGLVVQINMLQPGSTAPLVDVSPVDLARD